MHITADQLIPLTREKYDAILGKVELENEVSLPANANVIDHGAGPGVMSRFADGTFTVAIAGESYVLRHSIRDGKMLLTWNVTITPWNGEVVATPKLAANDAVGSLDGLEKALSLKPRVIGIIADHLVPAVSTYAFAALGIEVRYATPADARVVGEALGIGP